LIPSTHHCMLESETQIYGMFSQGKMLKLKAVAQRPAPTDEL